MAGSLAGRRLVNYLHRAQGVGTCPPGRRIHAALPRQRFTPKSDRSWRTIRKSRKVQYQGEKGEFFGQLRGKPTERLQILKAKKGYAVGAVRINAHLLIDGVVVSFMKVDGKYLDADQSYWEKVASIDADKRTEGTMVGAGGSLVIGICGRDDGRVCNALGLVLRGKTEK
jgi:hypothetical protein